MRPRKYFWATMLVAFWDQVTGNSTPRCSNAGLRGIADHGVANLPLDAVEGVLARLREAPRNADPVTGCGDPRGGGATAVRHDLSSYSGLISRERPMLLFAPDGTGRLDCELIFARKRVVLEASDHGLELVEVGEVAVDRGELDRAHGIHAREAALGEVADPLGLCLAAAAACLLHDPRRDLLELVGADRPPAGRPGEPAQQLLAIEALAPAVALDHLELRLLGALVGGEALAAARRTRAAGARRPGSGGCRSPGWSRPSRTDKAHREFYYP